MHLNCTGISNALISFRLLISFLIKGNNLTYDEMRNTEEYKARAYCECVEKKNLNICKTGSDWLERKSKLMSAHMNQEIINLKEGSEIFAVFRKEL